MSDSFGIFILAYNIVKTVGAFSEFGLVLKNFENPNL